MVEPQANENAALIAFAKETLPSVEFKTITSGEVTAQVAVVPEGRKLTEIKSLLDAWRTQPERRKGVAILRDVESFIAHVNRFKDADSVLFADPNPEKPILEAVLNYHRAASDGEPRFGDHRARYAFPLSDQWVKWLRHNDKEMDQRAFAEFVEDRIPDVADPSTAGQPMKDFVSSIGVEFASPSAVMTMSRGLSMKVDVQARSSINLSSGESQVFFSEDHQDETGKPMRVPGALMISIPVFELGALHNLGVRLRYRLQGGKVMWRYMIHRVPENFNAAIRDACGRVVGGVDLLLLYGCPE